jgi:hypothetical protein
MKLPNDTQRITVIGKTGSGKTQAGAWLLSERSYTTRPWILFDFKRERLLNAIPFAKHIGIDDKVPERPGIYLTHPIPGQRDRVDDMLWRIWDREHTGVFIDEAYMMHQRSDALLAVLTQGRSKNIPVIMLTQRPNWVTRFAFSEADYIQLFQLTDNRDKKTVKEFMPLPIEHPLPGKYYSWWYDNSHNFKAVLSPVPDASTILDRFYARLKPSRERY